MRWLLLLLLFLQVSCATKYIVPGNRFMTPESQGGVLQSSFEFQQASANQLTADVSNGSVKDGVMTDQVTRSGFLFQSSIMDQLDFFWNHTGSANSMFGGKFQFLGATRTGKGVGHKMALSLGIGENEHETDGSNSVLFTLRGQEYQLLYGFRFSELLLAYSNLAYGRFDFEGEINSRDDSIDGLEPKYQTRSLSLLVGVEITLGVFLAKVEGGYQQLKTTDTKDETALFGGYSIGISW